MKNPSPKMSAEDKKWQAESDCRTLIEYAEIMADKPRYKAAMVEAAEKKKALDAAMSAKPGDMSMGAYSKKRKKEMAKAA